MAIAATAIIATTAGLLLGFWLGLEVMADLCRRNCHNFRQSTCPND